MPKDDLKILISAELNKGKSIGDINTAIRGIQQKVNKLKLNVEVNDKVLASLNNFSKQMKNIGESARNAGKYVEEITNPDGSKIKKTFFDGLKGEFKQTETAAKKTKDEVGQLVSELDSYGKKVKEIQRLNAKGETIGSTSVFKDDKGILTSVNADKNGKVTSSQIIDNIEQIEMAQQKANDKELKAIKDIESARLSSINRVEKERLEAEQKQAQAINKNIDQTHKETQAEKNRTVILQQQLDIHKQKMALKSQELLKRYDGNIDTKELDRFTKSTEKMQVSLEKTPHEMRKNALGLKQIETNAKTAAGALDTGNRSAISFGQAMKTALIKFPIWIASASLIYAPIRAFRDAVTQIIEIDTQLTELMRVSNGQENINKVLAESIQLADELGNKVTSLNEAIIGFSRQGFRGDDLIAIAEVATLMSNVSTLSLDESMSGVTAAMKVFNIEAEESIKIVDALNEVDNNFSIETAQLTDSIKKAGGAARAFGVDMESLIG